MKKFIKKHLSVILSLAIVLTTLLPVLTGLGSVSALSAEEQVVVDNLKTAWGQMTTKPTSVLYPNYIFPNGSKTHMGDSIKATRGTLPYNATADMLGEYYVTNHNYTVTNTIDGTDSDQRILFYGNIANPNDANKNVTVYDGFYFNIYFEELTADVVVYANVVASGASNQSLAKGYTITADKKGSWVTIKDTDLINGGFAALGGKDKLNGLQLSMKTASTSTTVEAIVGSLQFVKNAKVPADSETADWTLVDWIKAALKVNIAEYNNAETFTAALAAAKTAFGEKYAIANLKKEWEALSVFHNPDINPNRWWNTSGTVSSAAMAESSTYTGTLPDGVDLGANYATFTGLGNASGVGSKQCILYEFYKDGSGTSVITTGAKSLNQINEIDDIYFWLKLDNLTTDATLNIQVMTNDNGAKSNNLPSYVVPVSKSGQWVKVSLKEIGGSEWYGALNEKLFRVMVAMANAQGATVTVGSGKIVIPGACPVPANIADTADAWIKAAKELDTSSCVDDSAFRAAISALSAYATVPNAAVETLKEEWAKLEYVGAPDSEGFKVGIWQNGGTTYKEGNSGATQLVYDTGVDTAYGENQFTATGVTASTFSDTNGAAYYRIAGNDQRSLVALSDMSDIKFWYKASGNANVRISFIGGDTVNNCKELNKIDNVALVSDNTWRQYSVKELIGESAWNTLMSTYGTYKLQRLLINIATFDDGVNSIDVNFGALNYYDRDTSLEGSASWTNEQWVDNARALDLSDYKNTAAFEAALYAAIESVYGFTKADLAAQELIAAWGELIGKSKSVLYPTYTFPNGSKTHMGNSIKATTGTLPYNATADMLGEYYVTNHNYTVTYTTNGTDSSQRILFYGNLDDANNAEKNVTGCNGFYLNIYFEELSSDLVVFANVVASGASNQSLAKGYTITADKKGSWVTIKDTDLINGGMAALGGLNKLNGLQLNLKTNSTSTTVKAVVGSLQFREKVSVPAGVAEMEPSEVLAAAMALDISKYGNTEAFVEKLEALKLLCEEDVAIAELKKAADNLSSNAAEYLYPRRYWDADGVLCEADTYATNVSDYTGALPEGADATNVKTYLGQKMGIISGLTDIAAAYKTSGNKQTVLYEYNSAGTTTFTAHKIKDAYFWYKLDGAESAKIINGIYVKHPETTKNTPYKLDGTITLIGDGKWHKVSFDEVYGKNWVENTGIANGKVYRIIMSIGNAAGGTITLGSINFEIKADLVPEGNKDWNLSDWIAVISRIDYSKYDGADVFEAALEKAIEIRDRLEISRSTNITNYDNGTDAEVDAATLGSANIFETLVPTVYHSADGETREEVASNNLISLTDGDITTVGSVSGLDNSNEASFTDFVYQFPGEASISDLFIYNDDANIADKYYIYVGNSQSDLFTHDNLVAPFANEEGKSVQRFNFDGKPEVAGVYLGIRVFGDTDTVSFAEFKAYGQVITYELEKGNFSNGKIADIGENILVGKTAKIKAGLKLDWSSFIDKKYKQENLTDADTSTPVAVYGQCSIKEKDQTISLHIYYDLGTTYTLDKLFINHWNNKGLETGKYEIYASRDVNSLFMSRSMLLSYDNTVDGPNGTTMSQLFTLKNKVVARYVSFHITYPISDWEYASTNPDYASALGVRLSEFGVYGEEWVKPYALVNLTSHVPVDIYRTDARGVTKEVGDSEYDGVEHKNTYDENEVTFADITIKDGEKLDFIYNLAAEMTLEEICMKLRSGTVKRMNIYASTVEDAIWESGSLIYSDYDGLGETYFGKGFASSPIKARYVRFEILENEGEDLKISEVSAIGGNDQEFTYLNLVEENPSAASLYLQDKSTGYFQGTSEYGNKWLGSWKTWNGMYPLRKAFDNDNDSVFDLFGGKNGKESVNMLLDLGTLNSIDNITLVGGSSKEYWPDELNFYFGDDSVALFQKDAVPAKSWTQSVDDAYYTYEFVPQVAQYVRIEFLRGENEVYSQYFDHIGAVIGEIQVNGLELKSRAVNGIAATVEDEKTGIKAEILALRENDVYDVIQGMLVVNRTPTEDELASAKEQGLKVDTDIYEIYFIDVNGDIVADTGGREIVLYIPEKLSSITEDIFVLLGEFGSLSMIEFDAADGYYYFTIDDISSALNVALGYMVEDEEEFEDTDDFDNEDFEDEDEFEEDDEEDEEETKRKKIKVIRKNKGENSYLWLILAIGAGVVVIAAGVVLFIVLKKKKDKENEE